MFRIDHYLGKEAVEELGAIRDVVENHLLEVLGLLAMEPPTSTYRESIRDEQVKVFRTIPPVDPADLVRGQYLGYRLSTGTWRCAQVARRNICCRAALD